MPSNQYVLSLLSWLLFPVYVVQGLQVRWKTKRQLPGNGSTLFTIDGAEPVVRLLVLGDSTVAGVGVELVADGLASQLAQMIAQRTGSATICRAAGFNSATSGELRNFAVPNLPAEPWTHILISIGTNDTKNFHTIGRFNREFGGLLYTLKAKWPDARISWANVVDMRIMPALPKCLGQVLEMRALLINAAGKQLCEERGATPSPRLELKATEGAFSPDGFHVSKEGYRVCAEHLLPVVLGEGITRP